VDVFVNPMSVKVSSTYFFQDSIPLPAADSINAKQFSREEVSNIFNALERREKKLDSLSRVRSQQRSTRPVQVPLARSFDTASVPYRDAPEKESLQDNPLTPATWKFLYSKDSTRNIFIEEAQVQSSTLKLQIQSESKDDLSESTLVARPDWLLGLILFCLVLIAWLKLFYNKFLNHTMQSLLNFQLSAKLLRDQNIFYKRVALTLNLNFILTGGAFIFLLFGHLNIQPFEFSGVVSYLTYSGLIAGLLLLRLIVSHLVGHVFNKHREFLEYQHQILLIYKNLGIYLIPLVFGIAYIHEDIRIYLIYMGGLLLLAATVLRVIRGFKILMNKEVLIFYLILYLCTLEILPLLIFYRFFSLSVLTG